MEGGHQFHVVERNWHVSGRLAERGIAEQDPFARRLDDIEAQRDVVHDPPSVGDPAVFMTVGVRCDYPRRVQSQHHLRTGMPLGPPCAAEKATRDLGDRAALGVNRTYRSELA